MRVCCLIDEAKRLSDDPASLMHEWFWLSVEAKRLDGESARLGAKSHGLGAGIERSKRHGKSRMGGGARQAALRSRHSCGSASVVDRKSSGIQACDARDGVIQLKRNALSRRPSAGRPSWQSQGRSALK